MKTSKTPYLFSIIVPVYEHWHLIPYLLHAISQQDVLENSYEVILVDNGSQDIVVPKQLPNYVKIIHCQPPGSYAARNQGAKLAQGEWLVFTDADCVPDKKWLAAYKEAIESYEDTSCLLAGPISMVLEGNDQNPYAIYDLIKGIPQKRYFQKGYAATANLVVSRQAFNKVGGFDAKRFSGGDAAFCRAVVNQKNPFYWVEAAEVCHPTRTTWLEIETKARRVKGGQWYSNARLYWLCKTILPPILEWSRFLRKSNHSLRNRLLACCVQSRVWWVELKEIAKLFAGHRAERQ